MTGRVTQQLTTCLVLPQVSTCKAGKLNDACFDKLKPLYCNGEPFVEQLKSALQQKNASLKKNVTDKAWKVNAEGGWGLASMSVGLS